MKTFEVDQECPACDGHGVYVGIAERDGAAVVCTRCKGAGWIRFKHNYKDFTGLKKRPDVSWVYETNPGVVIGTKGEDQTYKLSDFGGMDYQKWLDGEGFPLRSENRLFTCPAQWYQKADYDRMPRWDKCRGSVRFSNCKYFGSKQSCWDRWDREQEERS